MAQFRLSDIKLVSTSGSGVQGNGGSVNPSISADGSMVAFRSFASDLVPGDTNQAPDLFVKNLVTGEIVRANTSSSGAQSNAPPEEFSYLSDDGKSVGFVSTASNLVPDDTNAVQDVFVKDLVNGKTMRVNTAADGTQANGDTMYRCPRMEPRLSSPASRRTLFPETPTVRPTFFSRTCGPALSAW